MTNNPHTHCHALVVITSVPSHGGPIAVFAHVWRWRHCICTRSPVGPSSSLIDVVLDHTAYEDRDDATKRKSVDHETSSKGCGSSVKKSILTKVIASTWIPQVEDGFHPIVGNSHFFNHQLLPSLIVPLGPITVEFLNNYGSNDVDPSSNVPLSLRNGPEKDTKTWVWHIPHLCCWDQH